MDKAYNIISHIVIIMSIISAILGIIDGNLESAQLDIVTCGVLLILRKIEE